MLLVNELLLLRITVFFVLHCMWGNKENVGTVKLMDAQLIWKIL